MAFKNIFKRPAAESAESVETEASASGIKSRIGEEQIHEAMAMLHRYKEQKTSLEQRIISNEQWYKGRHWEEMRRSRNPGDPEPASGWLFNSIANKHADAMDNYPSPAVLPREQSDEQDAKELSEILPVVLEQNNFERTYSECWWYKLKNGTAVYGVYWNNEKNKGLGDIDIRKVDLINLFWEPGITDIQKSRNIFHVDLIDRDVAEELYPDLKGAFTASTIDIAEYVHDDSIDTSDKVAVIDWYYKTSRDGRDILHYCKFCNGKVLFASENEDGYEDGWYAHGKYPFVFDVLFPEEGSCAGFGYIDLMKDAQMYIDKLDQVILKHSIMGARPRWFVRGDGGINEQEYADWQRDFIHYTGSGSPSDDLMPVQVMGLDGTYAQIQQNKIQELKEISGNRDFNQGGTSGGVTTASGIAALQEAGSKLSRDMIKATYNSFANICYICIDLMRQFYTEERSFRILGSDGGMEYVMFNGQRIAAKPQEAEMGNDMGFRMPIFDIRVQSEKSSPFSTTAQNERAIQLYQLGFFRPDLADQSIACLDMMQFEGIEKVKARIADNGTMFEQIQQMQMQMQKMAAVLDAQNGTSILAGINAEQAANGNTQTPSSTPKTSGTKRSSGETIVAKARERAGSAASV